MALKGSSYLQDQNGPSLNHLRSGTGCFGSRQEELKPDGGLNRPPATSSSPPASCANHLPPDGGAWLNDTGLGGEKPARVRWQGSVIVFCISFHSTQSKQTAALQIWSLQEVSSYSLGGFGGGRRCFMLSLRSAV